jgi:hypothetical protein
VRARRGKGPCECPFCTERRRARHEVGSCDCDDCTALRRKHFPDGIDPWGRLPAQFYGYLPRGIHHQLVYPGETGSCPCGRCLLWETLLGPRGPEDTSVDPLDTPFPKRVPRLRELRRIEEALGALASAYNALNVPW